MIFKKIFIFSLIAMIFSQCNKIDEKIYDTAVTSNSLKTEADMVYMMAGTQSLLAENVYVTPGEMWNLLEYGGDMMMNITTNGSTGTVTSTKTVTPDYINLWYTYYSLYRAINNLNYMLDALPTLKVDSTFRVRAEGELKFNRAFCYYNLVTTWGAVPIRTTATTSSTEFNIPRSPVDSVYSLIFSDLKKASANLLHKSSPYIFKLGNSNKGAALGLLAVSYQRYGNYLDLGGKPSNATQAYTTSKMYCDSVINCGEYSLIPNYADLWDVSKEANAYKTEVIWGVRFARDANAGGTSAGSVFAYRSQPGSRAGVCGNVTAQGSGTNNNRVQPWAYKFYTTGTYAGDYRSDVTFLTKWTSRSNAAKTKVTWPMPVGPNDEVVGSTFPYDFPFINKYVDGLATNFSGQENDLFFIRLAEIYLIKAETENELNGPTAEAYAAFNMIRARARMATGTARLTPANLTPGLTKDQFRQAIFEERGLEFIGEAKRWGDLVRMKSSTSTTMMEYQYNKVLNTMVRAFPVWNATTQLWSVTDLEPTGSPTAFNPRWLLFPFPQAELDKNALFKQNPGY